MTTTAPIALRRRLTTLSALALAAVAAAPLAGCHNSDAPIEARGEQFDRPWLHLGDPQLRKDTMVSQARQSRDDSGILHVVIPVRNVTDRQLYVDYRVTFMDRNGAEVNHVTGNVTIPSHGNRDFTANSTDDRAQSFEVELNYPRVN